jgi:hypothetical protein
MIQIGLWTKEPISTLKKLSWRKYSCHKFSQFLHGINVLHGAASSVGGFLWTNTCFSSTQLNRPVWNKVSLSQPLINLILLTQMVFFWEEHVLFHISWIGIFVTKRNYIHFEKPKLQEVFLSKLAQFSQGNHVLDGPVSNADGFLWRDTCVSSTHLNKPT